MSKYHHFSARESYYAELKAQVCMLEMLEMLFITVTHVAFSSMLPIYTLKSLISLNLISF